MRSENINHDFLDGVLDGSHDDVYYHFGVTSRDALLEPLREVRAIVMSGSGHRAHEFATQWSGINGGAEIVAFPKEERFTTRYSAGVLFCSHGMGMPSASIAVQEMMRMVYFLKRGDHAAMHDVFWARVGTSGGVGLPGGTQVISTEGVMADLKPYRLLRGADGYYWFDGTFPEESRRAVVEASAGLGLRIEQGRTVAGNEFFLEQYRLDGAIRMETAESKMAWLRWLDANGVRNIEMEGAMFAGYLNHWGFPKFAMICAALLNRLEGDQVTASPDDLHRFSEDSGRVLFAYLESALLGH